MGCCLNPNSFPDNNDNVLCRDIYGNNIGTCLHEDEECSFLPMEIYNFNRYADMVTVTEITFVNDDGDCPTDTNPKTINRWDHITIEREKCRVTSIKAKMSDDGNEVICTAFESPQGFSGYEFRICGN